MVVEPGKPGRKPGDKAALISPVYTNSGPLRTHCAIFFYYMDGKDLGQLTVYVYLDGKKSTQQFTVSGESLLSTVCKNNLLLVRNFSGLKTLIVIYTKTCCKSAEVLQPMRTVH